MAIAAWPRVWYPPKRTGGDHEFAKKRAAVEMTLLWKSQNDSHRSLEISLKDARFPHFHKPILLSFR
jgi:hypothetical protein